MTALNTSEWPITPLTLVSTSDHRFAGKISSLCPSVLGDALVNLRESVLQHRVRYASLALLDRDSSQDHRTKALAALERYFFLIAYGAFVGESDPTFRTSFSTWLKSRSEIEKMISRLRKEGKGHFSVFAPVHDLSAIAKGEAGQLEVSNLKAAQRMYTGELVGDEWARQIVLVSPSSSHTGAAWRPCR